MPAAPASSDFLAAIDTATQQLRHVIDTVGPDAPVPTCPDWTVAALLAHTGHVHRWAHAQVVGGDDPYESDEQVLAEVAPADLGDWLEKGSAELIDALHSAPADLEAWVFMETGRTPLEFWTRRQAHETTVHAVDGLAAALTTTPTASQVYDALAISPDLAVDGLDELVLRFAPRGRSKMFDDKPLTVVVDPTDSDAVWTLSVTSDALTVTETDTAAADSRWSGSALQLYLALWNRGDEIVVDGDRAPWENWRARQRVR